jgi:16S rRNA (guanine966-N2)-methyltransferase
MRVVAGSARGLRISAPAAGEVRPTSDRVRESMFNALGSLGVVEDATVVDLFAGTGALGIEALSRGAASCTFVEHHGAAVEAIRTNLDHTGLSDRATVVRTDASSWVTGARHVDLALLDPPYRYDSDEWLELLALLDAEVIVVESDRFVELPPRWEVVRDKRYGTTFVRVARCLSPADRREVP